MQRGPHRPAHRGPDRERELLDTAGLLEKRKAYVRQLSGGQQRRFSVAAALVNDPQVLFLDEPTTGLDPQMRHGLWDLLRRLNRDEGKTVVLTTHYMEEAELLCDRVAIINHGRIRAIDTPRDLIARLDGLGAKVVVLPEQAVVLLVEADRVSDPDRLAGCVVDDGIEVADAVKERIQDGARGQIPETPKPGDPVFENVSNHVIANNRLLIEAAVAKARELNFSTLILGTEVEGEAKDIGRFFAAIAREIGRSGNPVKPPACILAAGETTVTVRGHGLGGRNQEMALAWSIAMASRAPGHATCFASVATDGTDGPTTAAGGLVDPFTCSRGVELGLMALIGIVLARYVRSQLAPGPFGPLAV